MNEGWLNDDYWVLFSGEDGEIISSKYGIEQFLPGYKVIGLRNWDDFIVQDLSGACYSVPTVPLVTQYLQPFGLPEALELEPDARLTGTVKWYVTPLVFGGDTEKGENLTWVSYEQHAELTAWWNMKYQEIKGSA